MDGYRHLTTSPEDDAPGSNILFVIGINRYENKRWRLHNAVSDALGIKQLFAETLGFKLPLAPLLDEQASRATIMKSVLVDLPEKLKQEDSLLLFFAGHGGTHEPQGDGEITGYIIPADAQPGLWHEYIDLEEFLKKVGQLPARHILVILDSCQSGFALGRAKLTFRLPPSLIDGEEVRKRKSRKVITSAQLSESARDSGSIPDHSLFTGLLIHGIHSAASEANSNGRITSSELGEFLQREVKRRSDGKQTPDFGPFHNDDHGEMFIQLPISGSPVLRTSSPSALTSPEEIFAFFQKAEQVMRDELEEKKAQLEVRRVQRLNSEIELVLWQMENARKNREDDDVQKLQKQAMALVQQLSSGLRETGNIFIR